MLHILVNEKDEIFCGMGRLAGMPGHANFNLPRPGEVVRACIYYSRAEAEAARDFVTGCGYPCTVADLILKN